MPWNKVIFVLMFIAATFAVIYVSFWTEEGTVARKAVPPVPANSTASPPAGNEK